MKLRPWHRVTFLVSVSAFALGTTIQGADGKKTRDQMVIEDRDELQNSDTWIYNDLGKAREAAAAAGKPMMVVFRCIP